MKLPKTQAEVVFFLLSNASRLDNEHFNSLMEKLEEWKRNRVISKYNQELVEKVRNREIVIEVDGFEGIKDLINYIYPDDPYLEDGYESKRFFYYTHNEKDKCYYWGSAFYNGHKEKVKAIEFLVK